MQRFSTWGTRTSGGTPDVLHGVRDGWLKLRFHATVQTFCHFVRSTKETLCFCNIIKLTENIFILSQHIKLLENVNTQVHHLLLSKDIQFSQLKYFVLKLLVSYDGFTSLQWLVPN